MSDITLKIILNKGRHGIVFRKLTKIAEEAEKFIESFANDVHLSEIEWVADDFKNGSLTFSLSYSGNEKPAIMANARKALAYIVDPKAKILSTDYGISPRTFHHLARMTSPIDADDSIGFAVLNEKGRFTTKYLTKERAVLIERETGQIVEQYVGIQGFVTALFREGSFWIKEFITGKRIVCHFRPILYSRIWKLLDEKEVLVNVEGWLLSKYGIPEFLKVEDVREAVEYREGDLDKFFGCDSKFTGKLSTEELINEIRGE